MSHRFIPTERNNPPQYVLTSTERKYAALGETGSRSPGYYRNRVAAKVQALPSRVQELYYDLSILYHGNQRDGSFMTQEVFDEELNISSGVTSDDLIVDDFEDIDWRSLHEVADGVDRQATPIPMSRADKSGIRCGANARLLVSRIEPLLEEPLNPAEYIWGQIVAVADGPETTSIQRKNRIEEILKEIEGLARMYKESSVETVESRLRQESRNEMVAVILDERGILPDTEIISQITGNIGEDNKSINKDRVEDEVNQLLEETALRQVDKLHKTLRDDIQAINNTRPDNMDIETVLRQIWGRYKSHIESVDERVAENSSEKSDEQDGEESEDEGEKLDRLPPSMKDGVTSIVSEMDISSLDDKNAQWLSPDKMSTSVCRSVVDEETLDETARIRGGTTEYPLLNEEDGPSYTYTKYGALLAYYLFEREKDAGWMYNFGPVPGFKYSFEQELLVAVANEIGIRLDDSYLIGAD